jgi:hypothetical protein
MGADFSFHAHPALSAAPKRPGKTSPHDWIQQQGMDLLSLGDEHLHTDSVALLCAGEEVSSAILLRTLPSVHWGRPAPTA